MSVDRVQSKDPVEPFLIPYVPPEIYVSILQKLWNPSAIMHFRETCTTWKNIADHSDVRKGVWKQLFDRYYQPLYSPKIVSDSAQAFQNRQGFHDHWKHGIYASCNLIKGPFREGIASVTLTLHEGKVFVSSCDSQVRIWEIATNQFKSLNAGQGNPKFAFFDDKIAAGGLSGHVGIWDAKTYDPLQVLEKNMGAIADLKFVKGEGLLIAIGASKIKIWNTDKDFECVFEGTSTDDPLCVYGAGKLAYSKSGSITITIVNIQEGTKKVISTGQDNRISRLALAEGNLVVAITDWYNHTKIKVLNFESGNFELVKTLEGHPDKINTLKVINRKLISCSFDTIKIWDVDAWRCLHTIKHKQTLNDIDLFDDKIITAANDGIRMWDMKHDQPLNWIRKRRVSSLVVVEGKCIAGCFNGRVKVYDMCAESPEIFAEVADLLKTQKPDEALRRYSRMPKEKRDPVDRALGPVDVQEGFLWPQFTITKKVHALKTVVFAEIHPLFTTDVSVSKQVENFFLQPEWTRKLIFKELGASTRSAILTEIAAHFEKSSDFTLFEKALEHFYILPEREKNRIYGKFMDLTDSYNLDDTIAVFSCMEPSLNLIRAQAIRD